MDWIEGIGLLAGFLGVFGWYPQVKRVWVDKKEGRWCKCSNFYSYCDFSSAVVNLWYIEEFNCYYYCKYFCLNYDN